MSENLQEQQNMPNNDDSVAEKDSFTASVIGKTAVKTVFWLITSLALFCALFVALFPFTAMNLALKLNLKTRAFDFAEKYVGSKYEENQLSVPDHRSNYVKGMFQCVTLSTDLFDQNADKPYKEFNADKVKYYAEKTELYTREFLKIGSINLFNQELDNYYMSKVAVGRRVNVYSYANGLEVYNYRAQLILGNNDKILRGKEYVELQTLINTMIGAELKAVDMDMYINVFNQLTAYIQYELNRCGIYNITNYSENGPLGNNVFDTYNDYFTLMFKKGTGATQHLKDLDKAVDNFKTFMVNYQPTSAEERLKQLYWARSLAYFTNNMWYMMISLYKNVNQYGNFGESIRTFHRTWQENLSVGVLIDGTSGGTVSDYYFGVLLPQYIEYVNSHKI